jgi:hypothetical protein
MLGRQKYVHTAQPLVPEPSPFGAEIAIAKLKKYKSPGCDKISAEVIQAGGETLRSQIHKLINDVGFEVFTVVVMKCIILWDMT